MPEGAATAPVGRRLVYHLVGYDPMSPAEAHGRFVREQTRFAATWGLRAQAGPFEASDDFAVWSAAAGGPDWRVDSEVRFLRWEDVMARVASASTPNRIGRGLLSFADFLIGGALVGYLRHAWRYTFFFLYPTLLVAGLALGGALAGWLAAWASGFWWAGLIAGALVFAGLVAWARHGAMLDHMYDDWIFARDYIRAPDPVLAARLDRVAEEVVAESKAGRFDEILLVGHSLGAVLAVDILDRALKGEPGLGAGPAPVALATVGSSIPKLGLHRGATRLRAALGRVGAAPNLFWVDWQARKDLLNFYRLHPVRGLGAGARGPIVRTTSLRRSLSPAYYRKIRSSWLRLHNQFVSGNDVRMPYDYFMLVCGPWSLERLTLAKAGALAGVAPDGSLIREPGEPFIADRGLDRMPT